MPRPRDIAAIDTLIGFRDRTHAAQVADSLGDPERPMADAELLEKARQLMAYGGVAAGRAQAVLEAARALQSGSAADSTTPFPKALLDPLF